MVEAQMKRCLWCRKVLRLRKLTHNATYRQKYRAADVLRKQKFCGVYCAGFSRKGKVIYYSFKCLECGRIASTQSKNKQRYYLKRRKFCGVVCANKSISRNLRLRKVSRLHPKKCFFCKKIFIRKYIYQQRNARFCGTACAYKFRKTSAFRKPLARKISIISKNLWKDPLFVKKIAKAFHTGKPNRLEARMLSFRNLVKRCGYSLRFTGNRKICVTFAGGTHKFPDFVIEPFDKTNSVIETWDPHPWHTAKEMRNIREKYRKINLRCLLVSSKDFKDLPRLERKVTSFLRGIHDK